MEPSLLLKKNKKVAAVLFHERCNVQLGAYTVKETLVQPYHSYV